MTTANKAVLAALLAGLASILGDLRGADSTLNFQDWVVTILAALVAGITVWAVPNYSRGGARKVEGGYSAIELAIGAVVLVILVLVLLRLAT